MATTMFLETELADKGGEGDPIEFEVGRSSFYGGENLIYLVIDGKTVILNERAGRELVDAFVRVGDYLGYRGH
ncbi:MAG: hypothetical protein EON58_15965 [Alphaproteobacteria bacterium]|nr:MAG: hypothetical protein EON58_15965 [Alphaproteobacteria bacterium]